ncbi:MAG: DUF4147 domain-containing protein [Balneolaceae bacterium]
MKEKLKEHHQVLEEIVSDYVSGKFFELDLDEIFSSIKSSGDVWVLGAGKASVAMARQAIDYFKDKIKDGIIIAPEKSKELHQIQVFKGSHPLPDNDTVSSSYELLNLARKIPKGDTVIFCLSGGASALFCIPAKGIELEEIRNCYELLLNSGASIHQINVVRKHLSETAGGRLGEVLSQTNLHSVILSDVPGDDPQSIGSAPTIPDSSTFKEAFQILKQFKLWDHMPHSARIHISKGMHGDVRENPGAGDQKWEHHSVNVISGAKVLAENISKELRDRGWNVFIAEEAYDDDLKKVSKKICSEAISVVSEDKPVSKPAALIYFGESTVNVSGKGKGGRNQEMALNAAISIEGQHSISLLSLGTDGMDGPTDAAGAIINSETALLARKKKLNPEEYLQNNDSYHFHEKMETLVKTGPTGNNLMDLQVVLVS